MTFTAVGAGWLVNAFGFMSSFIERLARFWFIAFGWFSGGDGNLRVGFDGFRIPMPVCGFRLLCSVRLAFITLCLAGLFGAFK